MKISVTSASGIEAVTKREIYRLLKIDAPAINGRITFDGSLEDIQKCNLYLRTAGKVLIVLKEFNAQTFDELFDGVYDIPWEDYVPKNGAFPVIAKSVESKLFAYSSIQSISKKAICKRLTEKYNKLVLEESGERYEIEVAIYKDKVTVSLNTTGEGLHRRGYRGLVGLAPLKETLACALIDLSVWNPDKPMADVFCGSGTIPIECARIALNIPSGIDRSFDFESWQTFDFSSFSNLKELAKSQIKWDREVNIYGADIDKEQVKLAKTHAKLAGVDKYITLECKDMRKFTSNESYGVIISNPPYGERLADRSEIETLYKDYGKMFNKLDNWSAYTLTSVTDFERLFKKKAQKKRKLYNGKIECNYYQILGEKPIK